MNTIVRRLLAALAPGSSSFYVLLAGCVSACTQQETGTEQVASPPSAVLAPRPSPGINPIRPDADSADLTQYALPQRHPVSQELLINGKKYQLQLAATADSAHMLSYISTGLTGEYFAADSNFSENPRVQGPDGRYIITLTAATGQRVFRRELKKADFYRVAVPDMVVVSEPHPPRFLGYFPQLGGLAFWQDINIPNSDVGGYIFMLLDMQGELRELHFGNQFGEGRTDCEPQPAPNGRALLTCSQLLRVGQPPLRLQKPQADIALARFLSDSTLLTIYSYGEYQMARAKDGTETMEFVVPNQLRRAPNAFVQTIQGRVLTSFRYQGFSVGMGYLVPRHYVWQNQTYYLLDEAKGLRLLNKQDPTLTQEVAFRQMSKFRAPRRPTEVRFRIENFEFYADKSHPAQVRYRRLTAAG